MLPLFSSRTGPQRPFIFLGRLQKLCLPLHLSAVQPLRCRTPTPGRHCRRLCSHANASTPSGSTGSSADNKKADDKRTDGEAPSPTPATTSGPPSDPEHSKPRQPRAPPGRRPAPSSGGSWLSDLFSKLKQTNIVRFVLNVAGLTLLMRFWPIGTPTSPLDTTPDGVVLRLAYSEFVKNVRRNDVARVVVDGNTLSFTLRPTSQLFKSVPKELDQRKISFQTTRPPDYPTPYETMLTNNVLITAVEKRPGSLLSNVLGFAVAFFVLASVLNKVPFRLPGRGGGARRHGSGGATPDAAQITFDDVAGVDEAKEELQEVVECLKDPERFSKLGARPPCGVLLVGPPGTGKTLLARAVAGEAGVPFFSTSASEFVELFVGMGALRVRDLFAEARKVAPSIVFIDEIDAVAKGRDNRLRSMGNDEREQTLNQLLTELDGFDTHRDQLVICIAATNRPDVLDSALLRPGRFDRRVPVERPDRIGREQILAVHINRNQLPLDPDVDIPSLASQTAGFTGADLANLVNEAALLAGRVGRSLVARCDFDSAVLRSIAGVEKKRSILRGEEKWVVARHEAGHAIVGAAVAALVPTSNLVERISIIPRSGGALGFAYSPPTEDRALMFDTEIRGQLAILMGGRAAEAATSAAVSTGAADDIRRATDLAHKAVAEFGLSAAVGPLSVSALAAGSSEYSMLMDGGGEVGKSVEREVRSMCEGALAVARDCVELNRKLHAALAGDLERDERIEGVALREALMNVQVPDSLRAFVLAGEVPVKVHTQITLDKR